MRVGRERSVICRGQCALARSEMEGTHPRWQVANSVVVVLPRMRAPLERRVMMHAASMAMGAFETYAAELY